MARGLEPTIIADRALGAVPKLTHVQYLAAACSIIIFSLGSQLFYFIPFYLFYPALICQTKEASFSCDRHRACDPDILSY